MKIERTNTEFIIRLPLAIPSEQMQDVIDYLRYKELTASYRTPQDEVDQLARDVNAAWAQKQQGNDAKP